MSQVQERKRLKPGMRKQEKGANLSTQVGSERFTTFVNSWQFNSYYYVIIMFSHEHRASTSHFCRLSCNSAEKALAANAEG